ncbi:MAG TPA: ATP-binding protein [Ruminiclostridium sp.]|nr:ATP-binding protein [Ruminiclostridium sp.]
MISQEYNVLSITGNQTASGRATKEDPYMSGRQYLADELERLRLILRKYIRDKRDNTAAYPGVVLSKEEIYSFLGDTNPGEQDNILLEDELNRLDNQIAKRLEASKLRGIHLSVPHLSRLLNLNQFEEKCLIACIAPELDHGYEKIYGYLEDDSSKKSPSINLLMKMFLSSEEERIEARKSFSAQAPLVRLLMEQGNDLSDSSIPLISRHLKLDDWIVDYLLDVSTLDSRLAHIAELKLVVNQRKTSRLNSVNDNILHFLDYYRNSRTSRSQMFYLYGPDGAGKKENVLTVCGWLGSPLITADVEKLVNSEIPFEESLRLLGRQVRISGSVLCLENFQLLVSEERSQQFRINRILQMLYEFSRTTFILGKTQWQLSTTDSRFAFVAVEYPYPSATERKEYWNEFSRRYLLDENLNLDNFSEVFCFTPGQIENALRLGETYSVWNGATNGKIDTNGLTYACYTQSNRKLGELAAKTKTLYTLDMLVLPEDQMSQMKEIYRQVKYRSIVYEKWGFEKRLALGKGLNIMFSGPPGSGKTMAAEAIANEIGLEIYKIDVSRVISKYIGETEKNLSEIFREAEASNAILFFDEADALFGKRSEVKDSHDRYANVEIGYLLQRMEEYKGIVILATNLNQNIDEAFLRRLHFNVQFPFPDKEQRRLIWQGMFPAGAPVDSTLDYDFLADKLVVAGGNIKNIVLNAAFYAAYEECQIGIKQILLAARREYKKMGKTFLKSDFDPYYQLIEVMK